MIPNRQSPAYALFTRRPILPAGKDRVLNESTTKGGQLIAHLNL